MSYFIAYSAFSYEHVLAILNGYQLNIKIINLDPVQLSLLHTSDVSTSAIVIASARTFTLEHKRRKQGGLYLALTIALTFCRFTLEDF